MAKPENKKFIPEFPLYRKYIEMIQEGTKTVEGRINSGRFRRVSPEDRIRFFDRNQPDFGVLCEITGIRKYPDFRSMLMSEGFQQMIPDVSTLEEAVNVYNAIPSYRERVRKSGVLALRLKVIHP